MKVYLDTSVIIGLADPLDSFHKLSLDFVNRLDNHEVERLSGSPLVMELGKLAETKGTRRGIDILNSMEEFGIRLKNTGIKEIWKLSDIYLEEGVLSKRHRLDLLHYASASLLECTHLASWNHRQFNDRTARKVSDVNAKHGLSNLIAGKPDYIMKVENLG